MKPQRVEAQRVLWIVLSPFVIGNVTQRLQRTVVRAEAPTSQYAVGANPFLGAARFLHLLWPKPSDAPPPSQPFVGSDEAEIGLPSPLCHLLQRKR
jgi:hypothetical protein